MRRYFLLTLLLFAGSPLYSGPEGGSTANPVFDDMGNTWRPIQITISTTSLVLISSAPVNAVVYQTTGTNLGISAWRFREIVNVSTCCLLALFPNQNFNAFSSTFGVVLSSDSTGRGMGGSWVVPNQDNVWGIWSPYGTAGITAGAGGSESYWSRSQLR